MNRTDLVIQGKELRAGDEAEVSALIGNPQVKSKAGTGCLRLCEVSVDTALRQQVLDACRARGWDAAFVPADLRLADFRAVFFDMDSTLASTETLDEIAAMLGVGEACAMITSDSMHGKLKDYAESLRRRTALLKGMDASVIEKVWEETSPNEGVVEWLQAVHAMGLKTYIVSSGFTIFTERMARKLGMTGACSNVIEIVDGRFTGGVSGMDGAPIFDATGKIDFVRKTMASMGCTPEQAICCGDGSNDVKMISAAGFGVGFRPKAVLRPHCTVALDVMGFDSLVNYFSDTSLV